MAEPDRLEILLADYQQAREEERVYYNSETALIAVTLTAITVAGGVGLFTKIPREWHDLVFAIVPVIAVIPLLFLVQAGTTAIWRSFYIRALEREIRTFAPSALSSYGGLPIISYGEMYIGASNGRGRDSAGLLKVILTVTYPIVVLIVGGLALALAVHIDLLPLRLLAFLAYGGGGIGILAYVARVHLRGRRFVNEQVSIVNERLAVRLDRPDEPRTRRSPFSYFVMPRPDEILTKTPFILAGVLLAVLAVGPQLPDLPDVLNVILLWTAIEFLIYQARYQWNDIRGFSEDEESPNASTRGRLPVFNLSRPVSWLVILVRIFGLFVVTTVPLGTGNWHLRVSPIVWIALGVVAVTAVLYELVRWWEVRRPASRLPQLILFVVVGWGYPTRLLIGYLSISPIVPLPVILVALAAWALGVYFVTITWLLEGGADFAWAPSGSTAAHPLRPIRRLAQTSERKPHLAALMRAAHVPLEVPQDRRAKSKNAATLRLLDVPRIPILPIGLAAAIWFPAWIFAIETLARPGNPPWSAITVAGISAVLACWPVPGSVSRWMLTAAAVPPIAYYVVVVGPQVSSDSLAVAELAAAVLAALTPLLMFAALRLDYDATRAVVARVGRWLRTAGLRIYEVASGIAPKKQDPA